jgi:hypothetical protein
MRQKYIFSKEHFYILAGTKLIMRKVILLSAVLVVLAVGMNSCKKCYNCSYRYTTKNASGNDSIVNLTTQICNHGSQSAGNNLNVAVQDLEANGYTCVSQ